MDCLFCKIIKGEIPCEKVYEDKSCLAFLDINPVNMGHTLIVPKNHSRNFLEMEKSEIKDFMPIVKKVSNAVMKATNAGGVNIISNNEDVAGQKVFHTHFHIIPRFSEDGHKHWQSGEYKEGEAENIKYKIIEEL